MQSSGWSMKRQACSILCGFLLLSRTFLVAQTPEPGPALSSDQLDNLVAPVALYPDSLLAQVFAAATYPLEIVEAQQWLQQNRGMQGTQLVEAAKQQNWDPSIQALVAFPDVLALLNRDVRWTTDLGNVFLAQQADVMNAVQRMRSRARDNGRLGNTPEQSVSVATGNGQAAIEIQPANPQVIYVPAYNPAYVWGPPVAGAYPALGYPGWGFGFNPGVLIGALFSGLLSFGGWGWGLSWLAHALFLNNLFFGHFGFGGSGGGLGGRTAWAHNPGHRMGVPYPNRALASRFAAGRSNGFSNARSYSARSFSGGFYSRSYESPASASSIHASSTGTRSYQSYNRSVDGNRYNSPALSSRSSSAYRSSAAMARAPAVRNSEPRYSASRNSAPRYSSQKMSSHNSAPRVSNPGKYRAPKASSHSGGHSSGHSGGHPGKHK